MFFTFGPSSQKTRPGEYRGSKNYVLGVTTHNFWMQAMSPSVVCREIATSGNWQSLVADAELELGPGGDKCVI